ncbi:MAG: tRNA pseudouridine(38-40) synthase TruA [Crenarchaeota archaeon]|nr:tRNA pseudouridine(38-40) synthase TruA [Thermoproteota archaeon]
MKLLYLVAYDGTMFHGFVGDSRSVLSTILYSFKKVAKEYSDVTYSSRTDPGVSALKNTICIRVPRFVRPEEVNSNLPRYVRIWGVTEVSEDFSARAAVERCYIYFKPYEGEDIELMRHVSKMFIGKHDFSNFMIFDEDQNPVTEIYSIDVDLDNLFVIFRFVGKGFRNKMIRKIVWTLEQVGRGVLSIDEVRDLLELKVRRTVPSAPAEGLVLVDVKYSADLRFSVSLRALSEFVGYLRERLRRMLSLSASYAYMLGKKSSCLLLQYFLNKPL